MNSRKHYFVLFMAATNIVRHLRGEAPDPNHLVS
jgi:hypothetical protein